MPLILSFSSFTFLFKFSLDAFISANSWPARAFDLIYSAVSNIRLSLFLPLLLGFKLQILRSPILLMDVKEFIELMETPDAELGSSLYKNTLEFKFPSCLLITTSLRLKFDKEVTDFKLSVAKC